MEVLDKVRESCLRADSKEYAREILIEAKAQTRIVDENYRQVINYLAISKCRLGLIYNFGSPSLFIKRVILGSLND